MRNTQLKYIFCLVILVISLLPLSAEDKRTIPLDMYLIVDDSTTMKNSKNDVFAWINEQVVDRIMADGDKITIFAAGDSARVIYSDDISSAGKTGIKGSFDSLNAEGKTADFSGALSEVNSRVSRTPESRLAITMLISGSAEILEPAIAGNAQGLLRWFRSEKYERWQALVVAPNIGGKVRNATVAYMSSTR